MKKRSEHMPYGEDYDYYHKGGTTIIEDCESLPNPIGFIHFPDLTVVQDQSPELPAWVAKSFLWALRMTIRVLRVFTRD